MSTFETQDGKTIKDGQKVSLRVGKGDPTVRETTLGGAPTHDYSESVITGTVRSFEQDGETRWEVVTDDAQYPAIGFLPKNVLTKV
jgi:hypothetical protein